MKLAITLCFFLVAGASAASQSDHSPASSVSSSVVSQAPNVAPVHNVPVAPLASGSSPEVPAPVSSVNGDHVHNSPLASYYSPAGMVSVVGADQLASKPYKAEQYGQPESASIPANYKPFGSWGLYIGGNPADGYYSNYYKSLANTVEKQQVGESVKPVVGVSSVNPMLKQSGSSYQTGDYYPFAYAQNDFSSGAQFQPVGSQVYSSPVVDQVPSSYAPESYAPVKKVGFVAHKESPKESPKSHHPKMQVYQAAAPIVGYYAAPVSSAVPVAVHGQQVQQVVPYPVPVGSQIVGSQAGVDGAFYPYGVHAFTRYVVKPVVGQEQSYQSPGVYSPSHLSAVNPNYKYSSYQSPVQMVSGQYSSYPYYQQGGYYAYPASSQLHYSSGVVGSSVHGSEVQHSPVFPADTVNEKSEDEEKVVGAKPMKRS